MDEGEKRGGRAETGENVQEEMEEEWSVEEGKEGKGWNADVEWEWKEMGENREKGK